MRKKNVGYFSWVSTDCGIILFPLHPIGEKRYKKPKTVLKKTIDLIKKNPILVKHVTHIFIVYEDEIGRRESYETYRVNVDDHYDFRDIRYKFDYVEPKKNLVIKFSKKVEG